jgi:acyl-CoA reductase-like NAD-dependent aldehyde dehydrogenase
MSGSQDLSITPVAAAGEATPVQPVASNRQVQPAASQAPAQPRHDVAAAATGGNLSPATAQFVINPDTHDVVIRVTDPASGQVISEYPSSQIEAMRKYMDAYARTAARQRASQHISPAK